MAQLLRRWPSAPESPVSRFEVATILYLNDFYGETEEVAKGGQTEAEFRRIIGKAKSSNPRLPISVTEPVVETRGKLSWHAFRHTHATLGEQIGMALSDRQAQMGHADVRMTLHYTHSDLNRRRAAIETMSGRLMGKASGTVN